MPLHPSADRTRFNFECHVSSVTSYTCRHVMSSFVQPCNQKNDIWSFRPKSRPTINIDWPESWILSAQSFYKDSCGFSVASLFDGWGVINSLCLSCRKTVVQKREGGLQPAAQTGNQTGTACQTRRPGELKRTKTRTQRNKTRGHWEGERAEPCPNLDYRLKTWLYDSSKVILVWCFKTLEPELWRDGLVKSRTSPMYQSHFMNTSREFLQICHKCPSWLEEGLMRFWWSKVKGQGSRSVSLAVTKKYKKKKKDLANV